MEEGWGEEVPIGEATGYPWELVSGELGGDCLKTVAADVSPR